MGLLSVGTGLLLSTLTAKYRDLAQIQGFLVQLWLYATPVIYPISKVPEKWQWIAHLNPMTAIVESTRRIFLGVGTVSPLQYGISILSSIFIFLLGVFCYQRAARTFVDTV
jgi:lipopolysaccharide transport system permease protein